MVMAGKQLRNYLPYMDNIMQALLDHNLLPPIEENEPFISTRRFRLYLGDIIDTLSKIPAESVDMIFADPPYNLSGSFDEESGLLNKHPHINMPDTI